MDPFDIRILLNAGVTPFYDTYDVYIPDVSLELPFTYKIKLKNYIYDDEGRQVVGRFFVERYLSNGKLDSKWVKEVHVDDQTYVDYFGTIVQPTINEETNEVTYPEGSMTEFERFSIFFNAPISDGIIVKQYKQQLFTNGRFYFQ